jgi:hypothetical protein
MSSRLGPRPTAFVAVFHATAVLSLEISSCRTHPIQTFDTECLQGRSGDAWIRRIPTLKFPRFEFMIFMVFMTQLLIRPLNIGPLGPLSEKAVFFWGIPAGVHAEQVVGQEQSFAFATCPQIVPPL